LRGFILRSAELKRYEEFLETQETEIQAKILVLVDALRTGTRGDDPVLAMKTNVLTAMLGYAFV
jgi:hypothetical protein